MKKTIFFLIFVILMILAALFFGISDKNLDSGPQTDSQYDAESTRILESMDTVMKLTAYGQNRENALDLAESEVRRLDALLSTENPGSEISKLNHSGRMVLSSDAAFLVNRSMALFHQTNGSFDITIYPLTKLWGFPTKEYRVPSEEELAAAAKLVDTNQILFDEVTGTITLGQNQEIDLGGIAKGYTSQKIMEIFRQNGVTSGMVSLGGNIQCLGLKPDGSTWKIAIQDPWNNRGQYVAVVEINNCAVITSGGYERFFTDSDTGKTYRHILDPKTGFPAESGLASVSIITEDGTLGDGLSTSLFIMGLDAASEFWRAHSREFDAVFVTDDGKVYATEGLKKSIFSEKKIQFIELSP